MSEFNIGKLIWARIKLNDMITQRTKDMKSSVEDLKKQLEMLDNQVLLMLNEAGVDSIKSENGTAYKDNKETFTVKDRDAFVTWVRENDTWEFLPAKVNAENARTYMKENGGALPPGVGYNCFIVPKFRRPTKKL